MTPDQKTLVQTTFAQVAPIGETAAALFYAKLFELDPSLRPPPGRLRAAGPIHPEPREPPRRLRRQRRALRDRRHRAALDAGGRARRGVHPGRAPGLDRRLHPARGHHERRRPAARPHRLTGQSHYPLSGWAARRLTLGWYPLPCQLPNFKVERCEDDRSDLSREYIQMGQLAGDDRERDTIGKRIAAPAAIVSTPQTTRVISRHGVLVVVHGCTTLTLRGCRAMTKSMPLPPASRTTRPSYPS